MTRPTWTTPPDDLWHRHRAAQEAARARTPGQTAYEEDKRRKPLYHDGRPRPAWTQLDHITRQSWERNPTPRDWPE